MTSLDPAYCADGCGRLAETERHWGGRIELVCRACYGALIDEVIQGLADAREPLVEHSSNPREDR